MKGYNVGLEDEKIFVDSQHMFGVNSTVYVSLNLSICLSAPEVCKRFSHLRLILVQNHLRFLMEQQG